MCGMSAQACLVLVEKRETRYRVQWYYRLFEETRSGLQPSQPLERCHGCLLALGELLAHTGTPPWPALPLPHASAPAEWLAALAHYHPFSDTCGMHLRS